MFTYIVCVNLASKSVFLTQNAGEVSELCVYSISMGVIVLLFSIPLIIFSVGINDVDNDFNSLFNLLIGIALIFLGVAPWSSAACIRLALKNK